MSATVWTCALCSTCGDTFGVVQWVWYRDQRLSVGPKCVWWCWAARHLVDISKRSLTVLTRQPMAPHRSSSRSHSSTDSNQFIWPSRQRLLRNCFISEGQKTRNPQSEYWCSLLVNIWGQLGGWLVLCIFRAEFEWQNPFCGHREVAEPAKSW